MTTRATRPPTLTLYGVCDNENGGPFNPFGSFYENKRQALADLRKYRRRYPEAYLAQCIYTRCPDQQKGR